VNFAANKLAMLKDNHFTSWANVTILSLNDNNLGSIGSLAPLAKLEELRLFANNLEAMPTLSSHPDLKVFEIHKNRIKDMADDYFKATPGLERLSIWGNALTKLPPSLTGCGALVGVQAYGNPDLATLPDGPWPATLETLFVQDTKITALPESLKACALKRVNLTKLALDGSSDSLAKEFEKMVLGKSDGIFWGTDGVQKKA